MAARWRPRRGRARAQLLAGIALLGLALLAQPPLAHAAFPGANGKIAFDSQRPPGFDFEIYSMNPDGTGQTDLTNNPGDDFAPAWSPGGQKIAFYSFRDGAAEVWTMNADGSGQTGLTTQAASPNSQPAWSPDGQKIVFVSGRDGNDEIYVMNANGTGQTRLTNNLAADEEPAFSPSGLKIVFVSDRDGNREVYSMNSDGTGQTRLTNNAAADYGPNWSPNGLQILFTSQRDGNAEIYRMSSSGGAQTRLTTDPAWDEQPAFSPDGTRIVFETQRDGCCAPEIYSMLANGSGPINLTQDPGDDGNPDWQSLPNGQIVVKLDSQPNDPQDFSFTAGGGLNPSSFTLDDDSDPTLSNTQTYTTVAPHSGYSLSESVPPGWDLSSATCDDGSPVTNIDVSPGETVTCTFTNRKQGTIVVVEDSQPNDPQDFSFTAGGGLNPSSFSLDDDSDPTLSNTRTFSGVPAGSGYSLAETLPTGWKRALASCDDGSPVSNIDVAPGETITCTFVNAKVFYDAPAAASTLSASIVPDFRQTISSSQCQARGGAPSIHGAPLALSSCNPPALAPGTQAHLGTQTSGLVQLGAVPGNLTTPADEADLSLSASLTDLHAATRNGADYNPNPSGADITLVFGVRIDDLYNGSTLSSPGTVADTSFATPVDCVTTPDPSVGSTCSASTSANAVTPGSIREGKQTILQVFRLRVNDSGANGVRGDSDDKVFAMQGLYVP